jgi:predicted DNA-binding transcriptional regulator AlpA
MKAELTFPPELIDQIAERVTEKIQPLIVGNGRHDPYDRWFNVRQLSDYIGMSAQWIYNNKDKLPHSNINNKPLFRKSEVDRWLESCRVNKSNEPIGLSVLKGMNHKNEIQSKGFSHQKR